jgi:hypothetical protein
MYLIEARVFFFALLCCIETKIPCGPRLLALAGAALHVLLEGLSNWDVSLLGLRVVRIELGRLRVARVSLGV